MQKQFSHKVQSTRIAAMFNPCTDSELVGDFATAPALAALLPDDIPMPVEPGEVEFQFSTGPGGVMPMTMVSVIVNRVMAFHWFLDTSDPVTWGGPRRLECPVRISSACLSRGIGDGPAAGSLSR
jgi:hypothetical protein